MTNNVHAVAELNLPSSEPEKFVWDLKSAEVGEIPRSTRSKPPEYHIYLASKKEATPPLTSTPKVVQLTDIPLPDSSGSWENDHKNSGEKFGVIHKQPSSFSGTSPIPYNPLDQVDVDADKCAIGNLPAVSLDAQSDVADEQSAVALDDIGGENLQALQQGVVIQAPLILNQVVIDPVGVPYHPIRPTQPFIYRQLLRWTTLILLIVLTTK